MSETLNTFEQGAVQSTPQHYLDTIEMPDWGTAPDGRRANIASDARLPGLFADWVADACQHTSRIVVRRDDSIGRPQYYGFCEHCGLKLSSAIAHHKVGTPSDYSAADMEERSGDYLRERQAQLDRITTQAAERAQSENRASYDDYLRSDTWRRRAAKIIQRAGGLCEGCLTNRASQVHHLTYAHLGDEFAFELIALCGKCHARIHEAA